MLRNVGKPKDLGESYKPVSYTSWLGKLMEKAAADNTCQRVKSNKKSYEQQNGSSKKQDINHNLWFPQKQPDYESIP